MTATALLVIDVQHDFLPGGALAVVGGDAVIGPISDLLDEPGLLRVFTRDAHTADHCSFHDQGGPWPVHCVAGTHGAELHPRLADRVDLLIEKATTSDLDAYSGFDGTGLAERLREAGVGRVIVTGLATDYCVKATVLDALAEGFEVTVRTDAVAAVEVEPGDGEAALAAMAEAGAVLA